MEEPYLEVELPPPSSPKKREQKEKEEPELILETAAVAPAPLMRIGLPEKAPEPPPQKPGAPFFFVHIVLHEDEKTRICVPAVINAELRPLLVMRLLRAALAAAEVYWPLMGVEPKRWFLIPDNWDLGAAVFGHRGVVACSLLTTPPYLHRLYAYGMVRAPGGWWALNASLDTWERVWATGEPPETLPVAAPAEPLDSAVTEALRRAANPSLLWLLQLKEEVGDAVAEARVGEESWERGFPIHILLI